MVIKGRCERCGKAYRVDALFVGNRATCDGCGHAFVLPSPDAVVPADASADTAWGMPAIVDSQQTRAEPVSPPPPTPLDQLSSVARPTRRRAQNPSRLGRNGPMIALILLLVVLIAVFVVIWMPGNDTPTPQSSREEYAPTPVTDQRARESATPPPAGYRPTSDGQAKRAAEILGSMASSGKPSSQQPSATSEAPAQGGVGLPAVATPTTAPGAVETAEAAGTHTSSKFGSFSRVVYPITGAPWMLLVRDEAGAQTVALWHLHPHEWKGSLRFPAEPAELAISPSGALLVRTTGRDALVAEVWAIVRQERQRRISLGPASMTQMVGLPNDSTLLVHRWEGFGNLLELWDVRTGRKLRSFPVGSWTREGSAISPDGSRAAIVQTGGGIGEVFLYDLDRGQVAARAALPGTGRGDKISVGGVAFAPDGEKLAVLLRSNGGWRVVTYVVGSPDVLSDLALSAGPGEPSGLNWLPDGSGWIALGGQVFDARTGGFVKRLTSEAVVGHRVIGAGMVQLEVKADRGRQILLQELDAPDVSAAISEARTEAHAVRNPPPLSPGLWAPPAEGVLYGGRLRWQPYAEAQPGQILPGFRPAPVRLGAEPGQMQIRFAPGPLHAVVLSGVRPALTDQATVPGTPTRLERYDLASGRKLSGFETPTYSRLLGISLDGELALLATPSSPGGPLDRVDVWATARGQHIAGWKPHEASPRSARDVTWGEVLSDELVLTHNGSTLVLWSLKARRGMWALKNIARPPVISPARGCLVVRHERALRFLDAASGMGRGDLDVPAFGAFELDSATFSPDGSQLLAFLTAPQGARLVRWDLRTGQVLQDLPAPAGTTGPVSFGGRHVLVGSLLLDTETQGAVARYRAEALLPGGPGGLHWYLARADGQGAALCAADLPRPEDFRLSLTGGIVELAAPLDVP